ncbi:SseB family protein [Streptomyces sp. NPDC050560]|uniref:SseB family protein n=1 Tax=Streptomyces sp. NPDC050560 TaxID=3365630 RepID=UPI003797AB75
MQTKNIPDPGFGTDDGAADPALEAALANWAAGACDEGPVLAALPGARLLVPVVAVLGELAEPGGTTGDGGGATGPDGGPLPREKTSDMAVPTLRAGDRVALPAFTSTAALARWDPDARPVAVPLHQALRAAVHEGADTVVLDLAGPVPYQLDRAALTALAEGRTSTRPLADPAVTAALRAAVATEAAVRAAHLAHGTGDGTLALVLDDGAKPAAVLHRVAELLAADPVLRERLVRGLDLAVLPPDAAPGGGALYERA